MPFVIAANPIPLHIDADGVVRVGKTRVTLDTVVSAYCDGATAEEIVLQYPSLQLSDVYVVIGYYLDHATEVDAYLEQRERVGAEVRQRNEARFDPHGTAIPKDRALWRQLGFWLSEAVVDKQKPTPVLFEHFAELLAYVA